MRHETKTVGRSIGFLAAAGALCSVQAAAGAPRAVHLGVSPDGGSVWAEGVSGDGRTVVGRVDVAGFWDLALIHTDARSVQSIPGLIEGNFHVLYAASADASVAVGSAGDVDGEQAVVHEHETGTLVRIFPVGEGGHSSRAIDVSHDGRWVLGMRRPAFDAADEIFLFDRLQGSVLTYGHPMPDQTWIEAYGLAADAPVFVGAWRTAAADGVPFRWRAGEEPEVLPLPDGYGPIGQASAASADGTVVVGAAFAPDGAVHALRWVGDVPHPLDPTPFSTFAIADDVSADGSVVAGYCFEGSGQRRAFIWTSSMGMRLLRDVLVDAGVDIGDLAFELVTGMSRDGRVLVGYDESGETFIGWKVELGDLLDEPTCPADMDGDGEATVNDLLRYLGAFRAGC